MTQTKKVAVLMGSDSDWPVVKGACAELKRLGIPFEEVQPYISSRIASQ